MLMNNSGLSQRRNNKTTRLRSSTTPSAATGPHSQGGNDKNDDVTAAAQDHKAAMAMRRCAQTASVAALVDLAQVAVQSPTGTTHALRNVLQTREGTLLFVWFVWKIVFAANLWGASNARLNIPKLKSSQNKTMESVQVILRSMTRVWRVGAIVVSVSATINMMSLFQEQIPAIHHIVGGAFLATVLVSAVFSMQETNKMDSAATTTTRDENQPDGGGVARIRRMGLITARSMAICSGVLFLQASLIPILALGQDSWIAGLIMLTNLPTPLAMATLLPSLRGSFLHLLSEITQQQETTKTKQLQETASETRLAVSGAELKFFPQVQTTVRNEMIVKLVNIAVCVFKSTRS